MPTTPTTTDVNDRIDAALAVRLAATTDRREVAILRAALGLDRLAGLGDRLGETDEDAEQLVGNAVADALFGLA